MSVSAWHRKRQCIGVCTHVYVCQPVCSAPPHKSHSYLTPRHFSNPPLALAPAHSFAHSHRSHLSSTLSSVRPSAAAAADRSHVGTPSQHSARLAHKPLAKSIPGTIRDPRVYPFRHASRKHSKHERNMKEICTHAAHAAAGVSAQRAP